MRLKALLLGTIFLALSAAARADEGFGEFKTDIPEIVAGNPAKALAPTPAQNLDPWTPQEEKPAPAISGDADLSLFFKRLEDLGFATQEIRDVAKKIEVVFRAPGGHAHAEWGYILDNLYIPHSFKEPDSGRIRYDLASNDIDTLIHEFTHAARDISAREDAAKGTPAREHYEAVKNIWASLRSRSLLYRFAWMKADEVSGYFMGAAVSSVVDAADAIILYNMFLGGSRPADLEEAKRLGGTLIIPTKENARDSWEKGFVTNRYAGPFGANSVYDSASFQDSGLTAPALIHWEESPKVKLDMYNNILGLKPPKDITDLLDRLNKADNDWIKGVRAKVAQARIKNADKAPPAR